MGATPDDPLARVREARRGVEDAQDELHAAVARARELGRSWADVGATLGVSRQAAFKRFATPTDPRHGTPMTRRTAPAVAELAGRALGLLAAGDLATLRALMTDETERHPGGTALAEGDSAVGTLVGVVRLVCEAGEWEGRLAGAVAGAGDGRVVGVLVCAPGADAAPF